MGNLSLCLTVIVRIFNKIIFIQRILKGKMSSELLRRLNSKSSHYNWSKLSKPKEVIVPNTITVRKGRRGRKALSLISSPQPNLDYGFDTFETYPSPIASPLPLDNDLADVYCQQCTVPPPLLDWDKENLPVHQNTSPINSPIVKNFVDLMRGESTPLLTPIVSPPHHSLLSVEHIANKTNLVHDLCDESSPEVPTRSTATLPSASSSKKKKFIVISDDEEDSEQDVSRENRPSNTLTTTANTAAPSSPGAKRTKAPKSVLKSRVIVLSDSEQRSDALDSPRTPPQAKKSIAPAGTASKPRVQFDSPGSRSGGYSDTDLASIKRGVKTGSGRKGRGASAKGSTPKAPKTPTRKVVVLSDSDSSRGDGNGSDSSNEEEVEEEEEEE